ncbi:MAG: ABC transporter substrate-binding protein [Candidatus Protistobacter heckmanni]|nr:ABC transporter substrate-binding protein [Candidatus Protistobacter heckmanni]
MTMEAPDDGFDMVRTANYYSGWVAEGIFETLLTYDYLARPARLTPLTAEAMPEVGDGGKTYTFHVRKGIYFSADPVFKGQRRELTAADYAYTFKRLLDPANRSPSTSFLEGKIAGLDALAAKAKKGGKFDYDAPVAGLQTPDRYTLKVLLNAPDYNFLYIVAHGALGAVAREAVEGYGQQLGAHPVGTGPYVLKQYVSRSKVILEANPDYRGYVWDFKDSAEPGNADDAQLVKDMQGKQMPRVGRVEMSMIDEEQSRWLAFQSGQVDIDKLPAIAAPKVLAGERLAPEYAAMGLRLLRTPEPEVTYTYFNMRDTLVGGMSLEKIALRRAIAMAYNLREEIVQIRRNQATAAPMMVPPGVAGHDPAYRSSMAYDPELANKLLDRFGYKRGAHGWRTLPDGKPLVLRIQSESSSASQQFAELWKRGLDKIGVKVEFPVSNFADNLRAATECKLMMWGGAWHADYPEGENFMQLLYGPNTGQGNTSCYQSADYDRLYRQAVALPPGPERAALYAQMNLRMEADTVWRLHVTRVRNWLIRPWVQGFKKHPFLHADWKYLDIDVSKQKQ